MTEIDGGNVEFVKLMVKRADTRCMPLKRYHNKTIFVAKMSNNFDGVTLYTTDRKETR